HPVSATAEPLAATSADRPVRGLRIFGELERFASRDEFCVQPDSLAGPRSKSRLLVGQSSISAATGQWLWRFSATSFPHLIRKSDRQARARRTGLPLVRRWARTSDSYACPMALPPEN